MREPCCLSNEDILLALAVLYPLTRSATQAVARSAGQEADQLSRTTPNALTGSPWTFRHVDD